MTVHTQAGSPQASELTPEFIDRFAVVGAPNVRHAAHRPRGARPRQAVVTGPSVGADREQRRMPRSASPPRSCLRSTAAGVSSPRDHDARTRLPDHLGRLAHHRAAEHLHRHIDPKYRDEPRTSIHRRRGRRRVRDPGHEDASADGSGRRRRGAARGDPPDRRALRGAAPRRVGPRARLDDQAGTAWRPRSSTRRSACSLQPPRLRLQEGLLRRLQPLDRRDCSATPID